MPPTLCRRLPVATALLFTAALAVPLLLAQAQGAARYALLVGVNQYRHDKLRALRFAENDASELAKVLEPAGYKVVLLTGSAADENARPTKANIERKLREVLRLCPPGGMVLVALSGHGLQFNGQADAYFCPQDARPFKDETDTLVSLGKMYQELDKSFAGMKVLLVDACRDDPAVGQLRGVGGVAADTAPRPPVGVAALFSCRAGEYAHEHEKLGHGVFFHHVLEGLKGKAQDADGEVTFAGLAAYVSRRVSGDVPVLFGSGARQSPNLKADYSAEPVLMARGTTTESRLITGEPFNTRVQPPRKPFVGKTEAVENGLDLRAIHYTRSDNWIVGLDRGEGNEKTVQAGNPRTRRPSLLVWDGSTGALLRRYEINAGVT
jgi:hypothetical protein